MSSKFLFFLNSPKLLFFSVSLYAACSYLFFFGWVNPFDVVTIAFLSLVFYFLCGWLFTLFMKNVVIYFNRLATIKKLYVIFCYTSIVFIFCWLTQLWLRFYFLIFMLILFCISTIVSKNINKAEKGSLRHAYEENSYAEKLVKSSDLSLLVRLEENFSFIPVWGIFALNIPFLKLFFFNDSGWLLFASILYGFFLCYTLIRLYVIVFSDTGIFYKLFSVSALLLFLFLILVLPTLMYMGDKTQSVVIMKPLQVFSKNALGKLPFLSDVELTLLNLALARLETVNNSIWFPRDRLRLPANPWIFNTEKILAADLAITNGSPPKQTLDILFSQCASLEPRAYSQLFSISNYAPNLSKSYIEALSLETAFLANKKLQESNSLQPKI